VLGRPGMGAHLARNARSASPEQVLTLLRNGCSPWAGIGAHLGPVHASAPTDPKNSELDDQIRQVQNTIEALGYHLSSLAEAYAETRVGRLLTSIKALEGEIAEMEKQRDDLFHRAGILTCPLVTKRIEELGEVIKADPLDRRKVNTLMRMVLSTVTVHPDTCQMYFTWKNGSEGDSLLYWWPRETAQAA
ncbi:hypothetical protein, partial [Archangium sp.]|uniref:hypothetical protein n=1 Tax=Archangium sp. TaxID=1872627 RepID=UPI00286B8BA0